MNPSYEIKTSSIGEQEQVLGMWVHLTHELHEHHYQPFGAPEQERFQILAEVLRNTYDSNRAVIFVAHNSKSEFLGTVAVVLNEQTGFCEPHSGVIFNLWVQQSARKKGVGLNLVKAAQAWLQEKGATTVQVGWHPDNVAADTFWKKLGFRLYEQVAAVKL